MKVLVFVLLNEKEKCYLMSSSFIVFFLLSAAAKTDEWLHLVIQPQNAFAIKVGNEEKKC